MENHEALIRLILPESLFEYFDVIDFKTSERRLDIFLDEKLEYPDGYSKKDLVSKGFTPSTIVQDFPLREKSTYLHLRRRKWQVLEDDRIISRKIKISTMGTRMTEEFATFLKGLLR
jgi:hypothetical protein